MSLRLMLRIAVTPLDLLIVAALPDDVDCRVIGLAIVPLNARLVTVWVVPDVSFKLPIGKSPRTLKVLLPIMV